MGSGSPEYLLSHGLFRLGPSSLPRVEWRLCLGWAGGLVLWRSLELQVWCQLFTPLGGNEETLPQPEGSFLWGYLMTSMSTMPGRGADRAPEAEQRDPESESVVAQSSLALCDPIDCI